MPVSNLGKEDKPEPFLLSEQEFMDWLEPGIKADLIQGEIFMQSPVNLRHARLINFLDHLLRSFLEEKPAGELHRETFAVRLSARNVFLPDLCFFNREQLARLVETHAPLAPALVVEALSPRTAERDLKIKFAVYEAHGVQEYWILDPDHLVHRFFKRENELLVEFAEHSPVIAAQTIPGFWVQRAWLDPARLPAARDCLREILASPNA